MHKNVWKTIFYLSGFQTSLLWKENLCKVLYSTDAKKYSLWIERLFVFDHFAWADRTGAINILNMLERIFLSNWPCTPYLMEGSCEVIVLIMSLNRFHRKARRALSVDVQRRVARKPWKEVKCSVNLRALIYAMPVRQENETVEAIVIDDD